MLKNILVLSLFTFLSSGVASGGGTFLEDSVSEKKVGHNHSLPGDRSSSSHTSFLFSVQCQAESGINSLNLLPEISGSEDDLSHSVLGQADVQRRVSIFLRYCRTLNQFFELSKLIYPFHFFF